MASIFYSMNHGKCSEDFICVRFEKESELKIVWLPATNILRQGWPTFVTLTSKFRAKFFEGQP